MFGESTVYRGWRSAPIISPIAMVMGHEKCGAAAAAVQRKEEPGHFPVRIGKIAPAVPIAASMVGDRLDNAIRENMVETVALLGQSTPLLVERLPEGKLQIPGARYEVDTGAVECLK